MRKKSSRGEGPVLEHRKNPLARASGSDPVRSIALLRRVPGSGRLAALGRGLHGSASITHTTACGSCHLLAGDGVRRRAHLDRAPESRPFTPKSGPHASRQPGETTLQRRLPINDNSAPPPPLRVAMLDTCPPDIPRASGGNAHEALATPIVVLRWTRKPAIRRSKRGGPGRVIQAANRFQRSDTGRSDDASKKHAGDGYCAGEQTQTDATWCANEAHHDNATHGGLTEATLDGTQTPRNGQATLLEENR